MNFCIRKAETPIFIGVITEALMYKKVHASVIYFSNIVQQMITTTSFYILSNSLFTNYPLTWLYIF
jgi:hypothetical protein